MYRCRHFLAESAARALTIPEVPASDLHVLIHSRCNASCLARPSAASVAARCEPVPAFPLLPRPSTCPVRPSAAPVAAMCEPIPAFPLLPGSPTCPERPSAASTSARCEPFSANRLTPASRDSGSWPGTMAAGAREQTASCDAFVLSRRLPAPDAPPIRTSPACLVAKPSPHHGPVTSDRAGTTAANSVRLGQGHPFRTALWPWLA